MRQGTIIKTPPTVQALSVADAKLQLKIEADDTDQDEHIARLCASAAQRVETELGYPLMRQTRETHLSGFPCGALWLGWGNQPSVVAIRYIDAVGAAQVMANTDYVVDAISRPASVSPAPGKSWPATQCRASAVVIEWQAGWTDGDAVPADLLHAMRLLVGHWDQNREAVVLGTISSEVQLAFDDLIRGHLPQSIG